MEHALSLEKPWYMALACQQLDVYFMKLNVMQKNENGSQKVDVAGQ